MICHLKTVDQNTYLYPLHAIFISKVRVLLFVVVVVTAVVAVILILIVDIRWQVTSE